MISIRKSLSELERAEQLKQLICSGYLHAIRGAAEYAIELDPAQAAEFRENLRKIGEQLQNATESEDFQAVQANLRGEFRLYRDNSGEWLERLQRDLKSATMAMEILANGVTANGVNHEVKVQSDLQALGEIEQSNDLAWIKKIVREAAESIGESWEQLRRANQLVIAQLSDEVRSLHSEIDNERRALFTDARSGAWNRQKIAQRIEEDLTREDGFCLIVACVTNLRRLESAHSEGVIDGALKALVKRVHGIVGKDAVIGRWSEDEFAILLELDPAHTKAVAAEISRELSARFSVQESGVARSLTLRVTTSMVDRAMGSDAARFREKLALLETKRRA